MGHRGHRDEEARTVSLAVLTISDTRTEATDESGALIRRLCAEAGHTVAVWRIVADEPGQIRAALADLLARPGVRAVLVTGGTGLSARDRTFPSC